MTTKEDKHNGFKRKEIKRKRTKVNLVSIPNPIYCIYFGKGNNKFKRRSNLEIYESPVVLKFHKSVWKYVVSYMLTA
jgi:hypothetical protein